MAEKEYRRLARSKPRPGFAAVSSRASLWLGQDHLLNLETTGYSESYRRFYFRDIQFITVRQTPHWLYVALVVGVIGLACLALAVAMSEPIARYIFGALGAAFGIALALDLAAGPTCLCHVRTAVQVEVLPALNRVRRAKRILEQVRPLMQEAQGVLTPGEMAVLAGQAELVSGAEARIEQPSGALEGVQGEGAEIDGRQVGDAIGEKAVSPETTGDKAAPQQMTGYKPVPPEDANRTA